MDSLPLSHLRSLGIEGISHIIKAIYDKPRANLLFNGEKLKAFPLRSEIRQKCPLAPFLCNVVSKVLTTASDKGKKGGGIHIVRKKVKLSLPADDMILWVGQSVHSVFSVTSYRKT